MNTEGLTPTRTITLVVGVLVVGILLVGVGYFAPVPPKLKEEAP